MANEALPEAGVQPQDGLADGPQVYVGGQLGHELREATIRREQAGESVRHCPELGHAIRKELAQERAPLAARLRLTVTKVLPRAEVCDAALHRVADLVDRLRCNQSAEHFLRHKRATKEEHSLLLPLEVQLNQRVCRQLLCVFLGLDLDLG